MPGQHPPRRMGPCVRRDDGGWKQRDTNMTPRSRGMLPEVCINVTLENQRAQGTPGACCTRGLVCNKRTRKRTRAYRYRRSIPTFPAQWPYGLCRALPGDEFVLSPSPAELTAASKPGWISQTSAELDTSNGCQDHTVLPYASAPFVCAPSAHSRSDRPANTACAPTLPRPPQPAPTLNASSRPSRMLHRMDAALNPDSRWKFARGGYLSSLLVRPAPERSLSSAG